MKLRILLLFSLLQTIAFAQTATDFTANDCDGTSHNLFTELNSGKVIVICWVMPCSACKGPALTTQNVVNSYLTSHPHTVYMYMCDDYANTTCTSLDSWRNNNGITSATLFSDAAINMADYGGNGMPKIVVIGGGSHTVFYTANDVVDANLLQDAIDQAIEVAGISEQNKFASALSISPNPASEKAMLKFNLSANAKVLVQIYSLQGKAVKQISPGNLSVGENEIEIKTDDLASGTYLVKISSGNKSNYINLAIAR